MAKSTIPDKVKCNDREAFLVEKVDAIRALAKNIVRDVIEIGRHLSEAKGKFGRGDNPEFLTWAKDALGWSQASVYRFLNVHDLAQRGDFTNLIKSDLDLSSLYLLAAPGTPSEVIVEVEERSRRGEKVTVAQVRELVTERKIIALGKTQESVAPPQRAVPLAAFAWPERTTTNVQLDDEFAAAQHLVIAMEVYHRSATEAKMAKLKRAATEDGRDHAAIRRIAEAIIDAIDANAGPATLSKVERRIAERRT